MNMPTDKKKIRILYLFPGPTYRPDLPNFKDRFEMLSEYFEGEIYSWSCDEKYKEFNVGDFVFRGLITRKEGFIRKICLTWHILKWGWVIRKKIDIIVCFEPMFTGVLGVIIKGFSRAKLIIEINSFNIGGAVQLEEFKFFGKSRVWVYRALSDFSLFFADGIRVLTELSFPQVARRFPERKVFCFHEYVPTHFFAKGQKSDRNYILCAGFPFYRKGIDILVKAFESIADKFPEMRLCCIGHKLAEEAKERLGSWHERVEFIKPVFYDELKPYFLNCTCFVLPSREEGMGCVILEAMSCGKPIIGSRVGGIPGLVHEGENGLLFESEDVDGLAQCLEKVLSDKEVRERMGRKSRELVESKFSSKKYGEYFRNMILEVLGDDYK